MGETSLPRERAIRRSLPSVDRLHTQRPSYRRDVDASTVDQWCAEYATHHDPELRDRIMSAHQWLVRLCAHKMQRRHEPLDDLVQIANIGLLKSLERFDPAFGVSFHTYASSTILGELRRHYRTTWQVHMPRSLQERHLLVRGATDLLTNQLGRTPSSDEIGAHLGLCTADVVEAATIGSSTWITALPDHDLPVFARSAGRPDDEIDAKLLMDDLLRRLHPLDRTILKLWAIEGLTQAEIGERYGLSQVQVSRTIRRNLQRLRSIVEHEDDDLAG